MVIERVVYWLGMCIGRVRRAYGTGKDRGERGALRMDEEEARQIVRVADLQRSFLTQSMVSSDENIMDRREE